MPEPTLTPVPPTPGSPVPLGTRSPAWIGARADGLIQITLPGVADRHAALVEREDGWWASEGSGAATVNGQPLSGSRLLASGDVLEITPGYRYEFSTGAAEPVAAVAPPAPVRKRRKRRHKSASDQQRPYAVVAVVLGIILLIGAAGVGIWFAVDHSRHGKDILTDQQLVEFDSLMVVADDHVERGSALLELGLEPKALDEFAAAVNTLTASDLRNHPELAPRVGALEAAIGAIYQERHLKTPSSYLGKTTTLSADQQRAATLTVTQFATAFAQVAAAFEARFGQAIEVTGRDHAEHLSLYGPGGALDLRARTMSPAQVAFVTTECHARKIRVKDFSQDAILQAEIRSAVQSGKLDQAGTGLHLHIDRFGGRRDRWTVALRSVAPGEVTAAGT
jgi:FHA domain-containing protein